MYNNKNNSFAQTDRFGNAYKLVSCKDKKGVGFPKGFIEISGVTYKIEPSRALEGKLDKNGVPILAWVKVTKMKKQTKQSF